LESELFGHAKGAFTDAREAHTGLFVQASGGTLFLDEIGDLPLGLQPKLLRALQERRVRPVGATKEVPIDVRIVVATNADLDRGVEEKRFRADLYFRLNVIHIEAPPLRARGGDVLLLAHHFLHEFAARAGKPVQRLSPGVARKLQAFSWPGNVRELQNCIERAVALASYDEIVEADLPERIRNPAQTLGNLVASGTGPVEFITVDELERRHIGQVLNATQGNKTEAARILGLARKTLYRKLEQYGYERAGSPEPEG
jgi:two-component system response regulator AtoC